MCNDFSSDVLKYSPVNDKFTKLSQSSTIIGQPIAWFCGTVKPVKIQRMASEQKQCSEWLEFETIQKEIQKEVKEQAELSKQLLSKQNKLKAKIKEQHKHWSRVLELTNDDPQIGAKMKEYRSELRTYDNQILNNGGYVKLMCPPTKPALTFPHTRNQHSDPHTQLHLLHFSNITCVPFLSNITTTPFLSQTFHLFHFSTITSILFLSNISSISHIIHAYTRCRFTHSSLDVYNFAHHTRTFFTVIHLHY